MAKSALKDAALFLAALAASTVSVSIAAAGEGKLYQASGTVAGITDQTILLQQGERRLEFDRDALDAGSDKLKVGDSVTLWFRLDARKARVRRGGSQEPGTAAPERKRDERKGPREKKQILLDDRAFYDARRGPVGTGETGSG
jgi:hypothetical protein